MTRLSKSRNKTNKENIDVIEILVKGDSLEEIIFRLDIKGNLTDLMKKYCERIGRKLKEVCFLYDGIKVKKRDTPQKLGMESGDEILCNIEQKGGSKKIHFF